VEQYEQLPYIDQWKWSEHGSRSHNSARLCYDLFTILVISLLTFKSHRVDLENIGSERLGWLSVKTRNFWKKIFYSLALYVWILLDINKQKMVLW